jgi:hypothetical protein
MYGHDAALVQLPIEIAPLVGCEPRHVAGPADPEAAGSLTPAPQPARQTAARSTQTDRPAIQLGGDGETVRDDQESIHGIPRYDNHI